MIELDLRVLNGKARSNLSRPLRASLNEYFMVQRLFSGSLKFRATEVKSGIRPERLLEYRPSIANRFKGQTAGIPVHVWVEGTQGVVGFISSPTVSDEQLRKIVSSDPIKKESESEPIVREERTDQVAPSLDDTISDVEPKAEVSEVSIGPNRYEITQTPEDDRDLVVSELKTRNLLQHDITCLRVFYLELMEAYFPEMKEGMAFIPLREFTAFAARVLDVPVARGKTGNFYSSRVLPFGEKGEKDNVQGWYLSVTKVSDFVKSVKRIPRIAHPHPRTLHFPPQGENGSAPGFDDLHEEGQAGPLPLTDDPVVAIEYVQSDRMQEFLDQVRTNMERSNELNRELAPLEESERQLAASLREIEAQIAQLNARRDEIGAERANAEARISAIKSELGKIAIPEPMRQTILHYADMFSQLRGMLK